MGKRKYRHLSSKEVAEKAWGELTSEKKLSEMKSNYVKKMDELPGTRMQSPGIRKVCLYGLRQ